MTPCARTQGVGVEDQTSASPAGSSVGGASAWSRATSTKGELTSQRNAPKTRLVFLEPRKTQSEKASETSRGFTRARLQQRVLYMSARSPEGEARAVPCAAQRPKHQITAARLPRELSVPRRRLLGAEKPGAEDVLLAF